jgi:hypothetical protein
MRRPDSLIVVIAVFAAAFSTNAEADPPTHAQSSTCLRANAQKIMLTPPLIQLLLNPERFNGCVVQVAGFLQYDYPSGRLFVSREDRAIDGALLGSIELSFHGRNRDIDLDRLKAVRKGVVYIQGLVKAGPDAPPMIVKIERAWPVEGGELGFDKAQ